MNKVINIAFMLAYLFPIDYFNRIFFIQIDKIFFSFSLLLLLPSLRLNLNKVLLIVVMIFQLLFFKIQSCFALLPFFFIDIDSSEFEFKVEKRWVLLTSIFIYSLLYYEKGRFIHIGIVDPNQSAFLILFLLMYSFKEKGVNKEVILYAILGILTMSRAFIVGLFFFFLIESSLKIKEKLMSIKNFLFLTSLSFVILIILSNVVEKKYKNGEIRGYRPTFIERIKSPFDSSNFYRFNINGNIYEIIKNNSKFFLKGITKEELLKINKENNESKNLPSSEIMPHNFYFSYLRIYGGFAVMIFVYLSNVLKKIITRNNISIYFVILFYLNILGIGFQSYFLILSFYLLYKNMGVNKE